MSLHIVPLSPNDHPTTALGYPRIVKGHRKIAIFQPTHASLKKAESCPHKGAGIGKVEIAPGTLSLIRGSQWKKIVEQDSLHSGG